MAKLITGVFKTRSSSMLAVEDLIRHGIPQEDISVLMTDTSNGREFYTDISSKAPEYGVMGTVIGAIAGGVLAALIALGYINLPGTGLTNIGVLYATLAGVGVGAVLGLLIGALAGLSVPEFETNFYPIDKRKHGGILVGTYCHERRENEVRRLMEASGATSLTAKSLATEPIRLHTTDKDYASAGAPLAGSSSTIATTSGDTLPPPDRLD